MCHFNFQGITSYGVNINLKRIQFIHAGLPITWDESLKTYVHPGTLNAAYENPPKTSRHYNPQDEASEALLNMISRKEQVIQILKKNIWEERLTEDIKTEED